MASTVIYQDPSLEYSNSSAQQPKQNSTLSPTYNRNSSPYSDPASLSEDSLLTSPTTPETPFLAEYSFARTESKRESKTVGLFDFGSFEDWMCWDEPAKAALSPTSEYFPELKPEPLSSNMNKQELQSGVTRLNDFISRTSDGSVVFIEDPVSEEPLFQTPAVMGATPGPDVPLREGLYSTPLSWTRPTLAQTQAYTGLLSPQEEMKLRNIAMPSNRISESYPTSPTSESSPEPTERSRKKRKQDDEEDEEMEEAAQTSDRHTPIKKTAHNMIEKRYRTNLNDKIAALRDSVPSLRVASKSKSSSGDIEEDLQGLTPAHKLNKATVLSKATEYIAHLEKRNRYLGRENAALKARVDAFEILVMARQPQPHPLQLQQQQTQLQQQQQQQQAQRNSLPRQGSQNWMR